jgi:16S rRNA (uracil1498-N3)-methyltransferase
VAPRAAVTATVVVRPEELHGDEVVVEGATYRHLFRARRLASGDRVRLVDGRGAARFATVGEVGRSRAVLAAGAPAPGNDPARRVELLVAAPRPERASWLVEKATELGVGAVRFLASERAVRGVDERALARLARVAAAALEQSGGARLPELSGPHGLDALPTLVADAAAWCLDPTAEGPLEGGGAGRAVVLVGPEGGWSDADLAAIRAAGVTRATLGSRILRVETAAIVAAARLLAGASV